MGDSGLNEVEAAAEALSVQDVFVLRRVEDDRFVHLGGVGRGEGWAGLIELRLSECPPAARAYGEMRPVTVTSDAVIHVFGPYHARSAVFVPVDHDVMVIVGDPDGDPPRCEPESLRRSASRAAGAVDMVSPAKRLADELELLHAVKNLLAAEPATTDEAMQHVVDCATESLSCEFGVVWLSEDDRIATSERGWSLEGRTDHALALVHALDPATDVPMCVQNALDRPLPAPFRPDDGIRSFYRLRLGDVGMIVLMHTDAEPRGFTALCQELGRRLAQSSEIVLRTAIRKDRLEDELGRVSNEARSDALTGVANRLAWDESIERRGREPQRLPTGVIIVDVDNLKTTNDTMGHDAGDRLLKTVASVLKDNVRPSDFVARLGGDEFGILLPDAPHGTCGAVVARMCEAAARERDPDGAPISFAHGLSVCDPGGDLGAAVRDADAAMYRDKQARNQRQRQAS